MIKTFLLSLSILCTFSAFAQRGPGDTIALGKVHVTKDPRIDILGRKMAEYNENVVSIKPVRGYRLMLLSTSDRALAMQVRSQLLQQYPDQKVYMAFQAPYIKLKFGNFEDKAEAERYRKMISGQGIVKGNIYFLPEMIEVKPDKDKDKDKNED